VAISSGIYAVYYSTTYLLQQGYRGFRAGYIAAIASAYGQIGRNGVYMRRRGQRRKDAWMGRQLPETLP